jgi:hypothetical protein
VLLTWETPTADANPTGLTFTGTQPQGTAGASLLTTVTNNGTAPLIVSGETFTAATPANGDDFFVSSTSCDHRVLPGGTCEIRVRFAPQGAGTRQATMNIKSNAGSDTQVSLQGTGGNLPTGPSGPSGATGPTGADGGKGQDGSQGPKGDTGATPRIAVSCVTRTRRVRGRKRSVIVCTVRNLSATGKVRARLSRAGKVYARGTGRVRSGKARVALRGRAGAGAYTLTIQSVHAVVRVTIRLR